jgi:hypothetical protein
MTWYVLRKLDIPAQTTDRYWKRVLAKTQCLSPEAGRSVGGQRGHELDRYYSDNEVLLTAGGRE